MTAPISSISGLASGIQWQDMVTQIIAAESARQLAPITQRATAAQARMDAWKGYQTVLGAVRGAANSLADGSTFNTFVATAGASSVTSRTLLSASAGATATPGAYKAEVVATATAEKLGGNVVSDPSAAMSLTGSFLVAGKQVTVGASDSLSAIRDKINAANTGAAPSHVSAAILTVSSGANRLILTNETTGAAGIELTENGGSSVLSSLGLVQSSLVSNTTSAGSVRSYGFASGTQTIAQALGVTMPPASSFIVAGQTVSVDLSQDSLSSVVSKINTAVGAGTASVATETVNGAVVSRILVNGTVTVNAADASLSTATLQQLGFLKNQRGGEVQTLRTATALIDSTTTLAATASSRLVNVGAVAGNSLTFAGTRVDGTAGSVTVVVTGTTTLQDVLNAITAPGAGFAVTGHGVTGSIDAQGRLQLADTVVGDSKLAFTATNDRVGGGTFDFGSTNVAVAGRAMQLASPSDAQVRLDGVLVTRSTNSITDAVAGVTLSLLHAEVGTTVDVNVTRNTDAIVLAVQTLTSAYNAAAQYVSAKTGAKGPLPFDSSMRGTLTGYRNALLGGVTGLANTTYTNAPLVGLTLDKNGTLSLDANAFKAALAANPGEVKSLFQTAGSSPLSSVQYMGSSANTKAGSYAVAITQAATTPVTTSSPMAGTYSNSAVANQMVVTDSFTGRTATIALADADTASTITSKLNTAFGVSLLRLTASVSGGAVQIAGSNYGSASKITVAFQLSGTAAAAQLGFAAGPVGGLDVAGTINGQAATGAGQLLSANVPAPGATNDAQGLALLYSGSGVASTTATFVRGLGGTFTSLTDGIALPGTGLIDTTTTALQTSVTSLTARQTDVQARLDRDAARLTKEFTAMETAMGKLQAQGQWLTGQINQMNGLNPAH